MNCKKTVRTRLCENRMLEIPFTAFWLDATVAKTVAISGESRAMSYVRKSQAVDLLWFSGSLRLLGMKPLKIDSSKNLADMWTKAISEATCEELKRKAGRKKKHVNNDTTEHIEPKQQIQNDTSDKVDILQGTQANHQGSH